MLIKEYSEEYLKDLTDLMNQWSTDTQYGLEEIGSSVRMIYKKSENRIFVAVDNENRAVGYLETGICYYLGFEPFVEIIELLVDEKHRSQGVGRLLVEYTADHYGKLGIGVIKLSSRVERDRAHKFYRELGFREFKESKFFEKKI